MRIGWSIMLLLPIATACSVSGTRPGDPLCTELAAFAEATQPGQVNSVTLRGGWGGDTPDTLMTHDCKHSGGGSGMAFCRYLLPNTSWEFGHYNAVRAATCLDSTSRHAFAKRVENYDVPVAITSPMRLLSDKRIQVTVRLENRPPSAESLSQLSVLTLSATRSGE